MKKIPISFLLILLLITTFVLSSCFSDGASGGSQATVPPHSTSSNQQSTPSSPAQSTPESSPQESSPNAHVHSWGDWTIINPADCLNDGLKKRTCSCGESEEEVIASPGHNIVTDAAVPPTCTESGREEGSHCTECDDVTVIGSTIGKLGHDFKDGFCTVCNTPAPTDLWDGTVDTSWFVENANTFDITTAAQFAGIAKLSNEGKTFENVTLNLLTSVDLGNLKWTPIGKETDFMGTFNGNGYTIYNFKIDNTYLSSTYNLGIFGFNKGVIRDLILDGFNVDISSQSTKNESLAFGALSSMHSGEMINCRVTNATVKINTPRWNIHFGTLFYSSPSGDITDCYTSSVTIDITAERVYVGGMGGGGGNFYNCVSESNFSVIASDLEIGGISSYGTFVNCHADTKITSTGSKRSYIGGLGARGKIINSYANTSIIDSGSKEVYAGGLAGIPSEIINSYAIGEIKVLNATSTVYAGGLAGKININAKNCFAAVNISVQAESMNVGLIAGIEEGTFYNCYVTDNVTLNLEGNNNNINSYYAPTKVSEKDLKSREWIATNLWKVEPDSYSYSEESYPTINYEYIKNTVIEISSAEQLKKLQNGTLVLKYKLTEDIDLGGEPWSRIHLFAGELDGNGHTISNFVITFNYEDNETFVGFIDYNLSGSITNLGIKNFRIEGFQNKEGIIGGLIGYDASRNNIVGCYAEGAIKITGYFDSSYMTIGGLIARKDNGKIKDCHSNVEINTPIHAPGLTTVCIGGLVGEGQFSHIENCYSLGSISCQGRNLAQPSVNAGGLVGGIASATKVSNCYSHVKINANMCDHIKAGGLIGSINSNPTIDRSYATGDIIVEDNVGIVYAGGLTGSSCNMSDCYATGNVIAKSYESIYAGGLFGSCGSNIKIENCYASGNVTAVSQSSTAGAGGLSGSLDYNAQIINCYALGNVHAESQYSKAYSGDLTGKSKNNIYVKNFFRITGQSITLKSAGSDSVILKGQEIALEEIKTIKFHTETLGWGDSWEFKDGELPTLKS